MLVQLRAVRMSRAAWSERLRQLAATAGAPVRAIKERSKYSAKKVQIDGITFDSQAEASRYVELRNMERAELISDLKVHETFRLVVNGILVCSYECDFRYLQDGRRITEDVKGVKTRDYQIKRKLMKAVHNIEIVEVAVKRKGRR